jgi:hypothetical protein
MSDKRSELEIFIEKLSDEIERQRDNFTDDSVTWGKLKFAMEDALSETKKHIQSRPSYTMD